jgi:hypothetical protein
MITEKRRNIECSNSDPQYLLDILRVFICRQRRAVLTEFLVRFLTPTSVEYMDSSPIRPSQLCFKIISSSSYMRHPPVRRCKAWLIAA